MSKLPKDAAGKAAKSVVSRLSEEKQLEMLRSKLAGHRAFAKCRGWFGNFPVEDILGTTMNEIQSPIAVLRSFDEWYSPRRIMFDMLAVLKRDGHGHAYRELHKALTDPRFVITGEEIPLQYRESGVLIIPDLPDALLLARWLYTSKREDAAHWVATGSLPRDSHASPELTQKLFEVFPNFAKHFDRPWPRGEFRPYGVKTCPSFWRDERNHGVYSKLCHGFDRSRFSTAGLVWAHYGIEGTRQEKWDNQRSLGYFVCNTDVPEVLKLFTREEQKRLSVWRFNYPKCNADMFGTENFPRGLVIGLHPEDEHSRWRKLWPCYTSSGCTSGLGAVLLGEMITSKNEKFKSYDPFPGFDQNSGTDLVKDIESRRIVIRLQWRD